MIFGPPEFVTARARAHTTAFCSHAATGICHLFIPFRGVRGARRRLGLRRWLRACLLEFRLTRGLGTPRRFRQLQCPAHVAPLALGQLAGSWTALWWLIDRDDANPLNSLAQEQELQVSRRTRARDLGPLAKMRSREIPQCDGQRRGRAFERPLAGQVVEPVAHWTSAAHIEELVHAVARAQ